MIASQSPILGYAANFFATMWIGFGINAMLRPANGLTFFELAPTNTASSKSLSTP
jgi:hypothetical protein